MGNSKLQLKTNKTMTYSYPPILELAFYKRETIKYYTVPDSVFILYNCDNAPPFISLVNTSNSCKDHIVDIAWKIYDENYHFDNACFYNERILKLCVVILGLFAERDEELIMVAKGFSEDILNQKGIFDTYSKLSLKQLDFLIKFACNKFSDKYQVLSFCKQGIDIIQDIQKETAGLILKQFRY